MEIGCPSVGHCTLLAAQPGSWHLSSQHGLIWSLILVLWLVAWPQWGCDRPAVRACVGILLRCHRPRLVHLDDARDMSSSAFPTLELPKSVAVNSWARQRSSQAEVAGQPGSPSDSRSSTPRSHGHGLRSSKDRSRQQTLIKQQQGEQCCVPPVYLPRAVAAHGGSSAVHSCLFA
jgi:hypothetical protein